MSATRLFHLFCAVFLLCSAFVPAAPTAPQAGRAVRPIACTPPTYVTGPPAARHADSPAPPWRVHPPGVAVA